MSYLPSRKACEILGLHPNTLRKYADNNIISTIKNFAGQRLYDVSSYIQKSENLDKTICYCRVSSRKQADDLDRQIAYMQSMYPNTEIITDIGSGINFKRKGLKTLLDRIMQGDKFTLVVTHKDRLTRFGFELFEYLITKNGGQILVLNNNNTSQQDELATDILTILHVFSCRMHGLRKYHNKIKEDLSQPNQTTEENPNDLGWNI